MSLVEKLKAPIYEAFKRFAIIPTQSFLSESGSLSYSHIKYA